MRTKLFWTLSIAVSIMITATSTAVAQKDDASSSDPITAKQRQRIEADILATRQQQQRDQNLATAGTAPVFMPGGAPGGFPVPAGAPQQPAQHFGMPSNAQSPFSNVQTATIFGGNNSQYDLALARVNNAANQQVMELVTKIKETEGEELKLELKAELKQILDEQYDEYLNHHEAPLKELEARLEKLRADFESRKKAKDDLVKLRLDTIWYDAIGLGWPNNSRSSNVFPTWRNPNQASDLNYLPGVPGPGVPGSSALVPRAASPGQPPRSNGTR